MPQPTDPAGRATYELDRAHVFHSWSAQDHVDPLVLVSGEGTWVTDADGKRYLDFASQLVFTNLGHSHPRIVAAIQEQAATLCTAAPPFATRARSRAAQLIAERAPQGLDKVFFTNGGADAVEHAVRMARQVTGRHKTLSLFRSYHGGTQMAVNITGEERRWANDLGVSGAVHCHGPFLYRSQFYASTEEQECERALEHLERLIRFEGPQGFAAIVLETVPGTAGIMPPPPGYLAGVRRICDEFGMLYIADEVMCGFGRTGAWFAFDHWQVRPDLVTFAKGVNSGYVPLGGVIISESIAAEFGQRPYPGGLTYSGHPLACAAAAATIETMAAEGVVEQAADTGAHRLGPGLHALGQRHRGVGEVRGLGMFFALDLVADPDTRTPLPAAAVARVVGACRERGLIVQPAANRIHVVPPLTTSAPEIDQGLAILDEALVHADG